MQAEEFIYPICLQNELIRVAAGERINPGTTGLMVCPAILIKDQYGNMSLAHADEKTDFSFILDEILRLKRINANAQCTVTIYRNTKRGLIPLEYKPDVILSLEKSLQGFRINYSVIPISEATVIVHEDDDITPIDPVNEMNMRTKGVLIYKDTMKNLQLDTYELQLASAFSPNKRKPLVVFENGHFNTARHPALAEDILNFIYTPLSKSQNSIAKFYRDRNGVAIIQNSLDSLQHVIPKYRKLKAILGYQTNQKEISEKFRCISTKNSIQKTESQLEIDSILTLLCK